MPRLTRRLLLAGAAATLPVPALAQSGDFPNRPVRVIVPYAPGGGTDVTTRALAEVLTQKYGHPFVVENRSGGNGAIGTELVQRAAPDGYTICVVTATHIMLRQMVPGLPFHPVNDFTAIGLVARYPLVLMAGLQQPFNDVQGLLAAARAKPGEVAQGTSDGATSYTANLFARRANVQMTEVPYRGGGAFLADITGGHLPVGWGSPGTAMQLMAGRQAKLLAVTSPQRFPLLPDVPTLREAGVQGSDFQGWIAMFGPARMPDAITNFLNRAIAEALQTTQLQERYRTLAMEAAPVTPAQFLAQIREEDAMWARAAADGMMPRG